MEEETLKKKKSLGQNFLKDKNILDKIVEAGEISQGELILEIGPGDGGLTEQILKKECRVVAIEKDDRLIPILKEKFAEQISSKKLVLIHKDILKFKPEDSGLTESNFKIIANIPYYITGEIMRKALSEWPKAKNVVLLVQKEVAKRIIASDQKESLLSISVKVFGEPKLIGIVKAGSFSPAPKVDSAILKIENITNKNFTNIDQERFFLIVKTGFAHKRKMISGNLKEIFKEKN
jgi:16S rRNA (adenine1518-N6/adenine1519-N6)-dimethyltransferase